MQGRRNLSCFIVMHGMVNPIVLWRFQSYLQHGAGFLLKKQSLDRVWSVHCMKENYTQFFSVIGLYKCDSISLGWATDSDSFRHIYFAQKTCNMRTNIYARFMAWLLTDANEEECRRWIALVSFTVCSL